MKHFQRTYNNTRFLDGAGPCATNIFRIDSGALPMLHSMMQTGMRVDLDHFAKLEKTLIDDMESITQWVKDETGVYCNLNSGDQKADLLFKKLGLRQAHPKRTKSDSRESVEDAVLIAIQHDHPIVPKILEFNEYSKLLGTYVQPMPRLARRVSFGHWRMFPNLTHTRVPSGRFAAKEPNLLAMPTRTERGREIRQGFIADPGWTYISCDFCLHPDTIVKLAYGEKRIGDIVAGDKVLAHNNNRITWGEVTKSSKIQYLPAYKLTFDNGESVIASSTHKWPVQTKRKKYGSASIEIKITEDLEIGTSMVPCKVGSDGPKKYKTWYSNKRYTFYTKEHILVAEAYHGPRPAGHEVHHKDENPGNNHPDNLEYKEEKKHKSDHAIENYKKQDHTLRITNLREGLKGRRSYEGSNNPNSRISDQARIRIKELALSGMKTRDIAEIYKVSMAYVREIATDRKARRKAAKLINHKLVSKEFVGLQPMWAITVEPHHNYVLGCGVVTCNSQIEPRAAAHRSKDPNLLRIYRNGEDIYSDFAIAAFRLQDERYFDKEAGKWKYPHVDSTAHRRPSKTCVLAALYDVTGGGLLEQMPIMCAGCNLEATKHTCDRFRPLWNETNCEQLLTAFYVRYPHLLKARKADHRNAMNNGYMWDAWGRILHVAAVYSVLPWVVAAALREVGNFPYQALAAGCLKLAMAAVHDDMEEGGLMDLVKFHLPIHDELLMSAREDIAEEVGHMVSDRFENCVRLDVPIKAGVAMAPAWGQLEK